MRNPFKRATRVDPIYAMQRRVIDDVHRRFLETGEVSQADADLLMAIGPVKGSGHYYPPGQRCHHMAPYPGCRGGCGG